MITVLPAYHDDAVTRNTAIGLGFELRTSLGTRRLVFTSDTGLYPRAEDSSGEPLFYDTDEQDPKLDEIEEHALYNVYPDEFKSPDLLVVHIGSIKEREFRTLEDSASRTPGQWYYANHLGALGTLTMLHQIKPRLAIVSEFGAELRGFHIELVAKIGEALSYRQEADKVPENEWTLVIPGDVTIAYDITNHRLLCHDNCQFEAPEVLEFRPCRDYARKWDDAAKEFET